MMYLQFLLTADMREREKDRRIIKIYKIELRFLKLSEIDENYNSWNQNWAMFNGRSPFQAIGF